MVFPAQLAYRVRCDLSRHFCGFHYSTWRGEFVAVHGDFKADSATDWLRHCKHSRTQRYVLLHRIIIKLIIINGIHHPVLSTIAPIAIIDWHRRTVAERNAGIEYRQKWLTIEQFLFWSREILKMSVMMELVITVSLQWLSTKVIYLLTLCYWYELVQVYVHGSI